MNPRTTGILFLVALALGAFVYFYEIGGEEGRREAEERQKQLFPKVEADDIAWIALRTKDGVDARFERDGAKWRLVEPLGFPADPAVGRLADTLATVTSESVFDNPQPFAEYGLDDAKARIVRFGTGKGDAAEEHQVRFGNATPVGGQTYAATGDSGPVYTVESYRATGFDKPLADLRDKRIVDFDRAAIREVEVRWPGDHVVLERNEEGKEGEDAWRMTAPLETRADDNAVKSLLSNLSYLRAEGFVDAPTAAQQALLEPPDVEVTLVPRDDDAKPIVVAVGRTEDGKKRVVRAGRPTLFEVAAERIADFPREVVAYRFRTLSKFALTDAKQVDFFFHPPVGDPVAITAERTDSGWTSQPEEFAPGKLPRVVSELSRLVAKDVLAEEVGESELETLGLSPPTTIVSVFGARPEAGSGGGGEEADGGDASGKQAEAAAAPKLAEVQLGRVTKDGVVARRAGEPTVYRLSPEVAEHLPVDLASFRSRFRAEEKPPAEEEEEEGPPLDSAPGPAGDVPSPREESP